jgi:alanyl-tRNA synthetase
MNEKIWGSERVFKQEMKKDDAIGAGAIALFGEKYGERVRVVKVGEFSTELCGGTHVDNSAEINLFKVASESGIAAGVRRVIAYTSKGAFEYLRTQETAVKTIQDRLKTSSSDEILGKIEKMAALERELRKQIEQMQSKSAGNEVDEILAAASSFNGVQIVAAICSPDAQGVKRLRDISDRIKQKSPSSIIILGMKDPEGSKATLLVARGSLASQSLNANELLQAIAFYIEGKGGGKADLAQAGGVKPSGLTEAITHAKVWVEKKLQA